MGRNGARDAAETVCAAISPADVASEITTRRNDTTVRFMAAFYRNREARPSNLGARLAQPASPGNVPEGVLKTWRSRKRNPPRRSSLGDLALMHRCRWSRRKHWG